MEVILGILNLLFVVAFARNEQTKKTDGLVQKAYYLLGIVSGIAFSAFSGIYFLCKIGVIPMNKDSMLYFLYCFCLAFLFQAEWLQPAKEKQKRLIGEFPVI